MTIAPGNNTVACTTSTSMTSMSLAVPAGVQDGDLLVALVTSDTDGNVADITAPPGWTESSEDGSGGPRAKVFWRIAANEPASYSFTATSWQTVSSMCRMVQFTGVSSSAINVDATFSNNAGSPASAASITPTSGVGALLYGYITEAQTTNPALSVPSGLTQIAQGWSDSDQFIYSGLFWRSYTSTTATPAENSTYPVTSWSSTSFVLAINTGMPSYNVTGSLGMTGSATTGGEPAVSVSGGPQMSGAASIGPIGSASVTGSMTMSGSATGGAQNQVNTTPPPRAGVPLVTPKSDAVPQTWRVSLAETTTGRVVLDLPLGGQSAPSWTRELNGIGALTNISVQPFPLLDGDTLTALQQMYRYTVLLSYGGWIAQAAIIDNVVCNDAQSPPTLTVGGITVWDFLAKKRPAFYYGHNLTDSSGDIVFSATSPDAANRNLSWAGVARRLTEIALGGPGANGPTSTAPISSGLSLPLVLPDNSSMAGSATITYAIADLAYSGQRIQETVAQNVEIEFSPEWIDDSHTRFQWRMRCTDKRLGQLGYPWAWDYRMACQSLSVTIDGSAMSYEDLEKGQDTRSGATPSGAKASGTLTWAWSDHTTTAATNTYVNAGWPWLITSGTSHSSETNATVLNGLANNYVKTNQLPVSTAVAVIRNDGLSINGEATGSPKVSSLSVGDTSVFTLSGHPLLTDGSYACRILSMTQGTDLFTSTLTLQILGTVT